LLLAADAPTRHAATIFAMRPLFEKMPPAQHHAPRHVATPLAAMSAISPDAVVCCPISCHAAATP